MVTFKTDTAFQLPENENILISFLLPERLWDTVPNSIPFNEPKDRTPKEDKGAGRKIVTGRNVNGYTFFKTLKKLSWNITELHIVDWTQHRKLFKRLNIVYSISGDAIHIDATADSFLEHLYSKYMWNQFSLWENMGSNNPSSFNFAWPKDIGNINEARGHLHLCTTSDSISVVTLEDQTSM